MKRIRVTTSITLLICLFILLGACSQETQDNARDEISTPVPTTASIPEIIETVPSVDLEFDDYEYMYPSGRDRVWEQDVVYFAQMYLGEKPTKGHPYLIKDDIQLIDANQNTSMSCFYNEELRTQFIQEIRELITQIPELSDTGIIYELQRIVALLNDGHSYVNLNDTEFFQFVVEPLISDGNVNFYIVRLPAQYEHLLYSKLISINDVPLDEIVTRLSHYISAENEYWESYKTTSIECNGLIMKKAALQAIDIMDEEDDTAIFTLLDSNGISHELELEAVEAPEEYFATELIAKEHTKVWEYSYSQFKVSAHWKEQSKEKVSDYWLEYLSDCNILYLRLYDIPSKKKSSFDDFIKQVNEQLEAIDGTRNVMIDFRDNGGGNYELIEPLLKTLATADQMYILINESCFSACVASVYELKTSGTEVTVLGAPAGQSPNFFGSTRTYELKSHNVSFTIPYIYWEMAPDYQHDALMPDVLIYPFYDDYLFGIDTVLESAFDLAGQN